MLYYHSSVISFDQKGEILENKMHYHYIDLTISCLETESKTIFAMVFYLVFVYFSCQLFVILDAHQCEGYV